MKLSWHYSQPSKTPFYSRGQRFSRHDNKVDRALEGTENDAQESSIVRHFGFTFGWRDSLKF